LMLWSLALAAVRWLMIGFGVEYPAMIWAAQLLHAASFATFHAAAMTLIYRHFGEGSQGQGQALYSMLWGTGVALGAWLAGMLWSNAMAGWIFATATALCLLALLLLMQSFRQASAP